MHLRNVTIANIQQSQCLPVQVDAFKCIVYSGRMVKQELS